MDFLSIFMTEQSVKTPHDSKRVSTFAGVDESAPFHRLDGIAIGRQRAYFFIVFQTPQSWVCTERSVPS
jgi:hypothetical protein